ENPKRPSQSRRQAVRGVYRSPAAKPRQRSPPSCSQRGRRLATTAHVSITSVRGTVHPGCEPLRDCTPQRRSSINNIPDLFTHDTVTIRCDPYHVCSELGKGVSV